MSEQPQFISQQCLEILKACLIMIYDKNIRKLLTECKSLYVVKEALKAAHPPGLVDSMLEQALHSEDIRRSVDDQIQSRVAVLQSMSSATLNHIVEFLYGDEQKGPLQ